MMRYFLALLITLSFMIGGISLAQANLGTTPSVFDDQLNAATKEAKGLVSATAGQEKTALSVYVAKIIQGFLSLLGVIAVVLVMYAGFLWMTASGNEESVTKAKELLTNAVIGLAIILLSYAITRFIFNALILKQQTI